MFCVRQLDLTWRSQTVWAGNHQAVFTGAIAEIRNVLPVRRPSRVALGRTTGVRKVADVAFLCGYGEDLAAGFEQYALACGRERQVGHLVGHVLPARHHPRKVAGGGDVDKVDPSGLRVE